MFEHSFIIFKSNSTNIELFLLVIFFKGLNFRFMNLANLREDLKTAISGFGAVDKEEYLEAIKRMDALSKNSTLPKQLQHYLSRRSYHKAKDFLDTSGA